MANETVEKDSISFRDAYVKVGQALEKLKDFDLEKNITSKKSLGSPSNLDLDYYKNILEKL